MAYDADGNFYNPYQPGTFEYDYEESQRSQPTVELTPEQNAQEIAAYELARKNQLPIDYSIGERYLSGGSDSWMNNIGRIVLAIAPLVIPGIGAALGSGILSAAGITGASTAVTAGVGAAALSAATTAVAGGTVEDVIKNAAGAGFASGLNISMGGGVAGAVTGSTAGTILKGGDASQVLTNAFAAGVGAGVQGAMTENPDAGKIIGSAARTYIATGGDMDQTLLNTAATAIGTLDNPAKTVQQAQAAVTPASDAAEQERAAREIEAVTQSDAARRQELANYQEVLNQYAIDKAIYEQTYGPIETAAPPAAAPSVAPAAEATLPPQTVVAPAPVVSPVVTDLDLVKQVAAQPTPTVDPKELERVIVQGQGANVANVAPVSTEITAPRPDTTPATELAPVTVTAKREEEPAPVVTDIPELRPDTTRGLPAPIPQLEPVTITAKREEEVAPTVTELPPVTVTGQQEPARELEPVTITARREEEVAPTVTELPPVTITAPTEPVYELPPVTVTGRREEEIAPTVTDIPPVVRELEPVTVTAKREEEVAPTITDIVAKTMEPPPAPPSPPAPEVKAEEPKKEEAPKKEAKKLYPTVTSVPPPKRPGRQPIITGASPARLLADALAAYRPAGAIEGEESGKERQNVWNEKSLRLKDALGL